MAANCDNLSNITYYVLDHTYFIEPTLYRRMHTSHHLKFQIEIDNQVWIPRNGTHINYEIWIYPTIMGLWMIWFQFITANVQTDFVRAWRRNQKKNSILLQILCVFLYIYVYSVLSINWVLNWLHKIYIFIAKALGYFTAVIVNCLILFEMYTWTFHFKFISEFDRWKRRFQINQTQQMMGIFFKSEMVGWIQ